VMLFEHNHLHKHQALEIFSPYNLRSAPWNKFIPRIDKHHKIEKEKGRST